jgi:tRNA threonylcarbamoyl adenosine modification protein YjeE
MRHIFSSQRDLETFAARFAGGLEAGDAVGLSGPLGSGKTTFVRAVVRALHGDDPTSSPTFTFWHRYPGTPPIDHLDLYRVETPGELTELGLEDAFDGRSIVLVEWWERAPELLPGRRYEVTFGGVGDGPRTVDVTEPA